MDVVEQRIEEKKVWLEDHFNSLKLKWPKTVNLQRFDGSRADSRQLDSFSQKWREEYYKEAEYRYLYHSMATAAYYVMREAGRNGKRDFDLAALSFADIATKFASQVRWHFEDPYPALDDDIAYIMRDGEED